MGRRKIDQASMVWLRMRKIVFGSIWMRRRGLQGWDEMHRRDGWWRFNVEAMINTLIRVWRPFKGAQGRAVDDNLFVFEFHHERDMRRVLEGGPWHFDNQLVVLKQIDNVAEAQAGILTRCAFWIRIQGLSPFRIFGEQARGISMKLGCFLEYDGDIGESLSYEYIRIRVSVDITKPIRRGMFMVIKGVPKWFDFRYERLPNYCFWCGVFDHVERECVVAFDDNAKEGDSHKFVGLRAVVSRPIFTKIANSTRWEAGNEKGEIGPRFMHRNSSLDNQELGVEAVPDTIDPGLETSLTVLCLQERTKKGGGAPAGLPGELRSEVKHGTSSTTWEGRGRTRAGCEPMVSQGIMASGVARAIAPRDSMVDCNGVRTRGEMDGCPKVSVVLRNLVDQLSGGASEKEFLIPIKKVPSHEGKGTGSMDNAIVQDGVNSEPGLSTSLRKWKRQLRAQKKQTVEVDGVIQKTHEDDVGVVMQWKRGLELEMDDIGGCKRARQVDATILAQSTAVPAIQARRSP